MCPTVGERVGRSRSDFLETTEMMKMPMIQMHNAYYLVP